VGGERISLAGDRVRMSLGDQYGIRQFESFVAAIPATLWDLDLSNTRTRALLGIGYRTLDGISYTREPMKAFPQAWISHDARFVTTVADLRAHLADPSIDLRETAIVLGRNVPLALTGKVSGVSDSVTVEPVEHITSDHIFIRFQTGSRALLTYSGVHFPGWQASTDGIPTRILRTYGALTRIVAEPGTHIVKLRYKPVSVRLGAFLTIAGLVSVVAIRWTTRRESQKGLVTATSKVPYP